MCGVGEGVWDAMGVDVLWVREVVDEGVSIKRVDGRGGEGVRASCTCYVHATSLFMCVVSLAFLCSSHLLQL